MYLELHRGVFTSQLRTKQGNRRNEALLREAELWAATAALRAGLAYPRAELEVAWRTVLLLQFHDILPGSSIAWVHREVERRHAEVSETLEAIIDWSLDALAGEGGARDLVANSAPFARDGVPALSIGPVARDAAPVMTAPVPDGDVLDNGVIRAVVDGDGHLVSLMTHDDGRDNPPGGAASVLRLHRDLPSKWDAWDIDAHHRRTVTELTDVDERRLDWSPSAVTVVTVRRLGASTIEQRLTLRAGAAALDLELRIDWHEREKLLKLVFPLDVHADRVAAETQFGHGFRTTHTNTSWEAAHFEACQHRFVHIAGAGVRRRHRQQFDLRLRRGPHHPPRRRLDHHRALLAHPRPALP